LVLDSWEFLLGDAVSWEELQRKDRVLPPVGPPRLCSTRRTGLSSNFGFGRRSSVRGGVEQRLSKVSAFKLRSSGFVVEGVRLAKQLHLICYVPFANGWFAFERFKFA
jgi:hypothetical protein